MTSREELLNLFKEICIRFDTDPKRYSKFDFGALLKYIKGDSDSISEIINSLASLNINLSDANEIIVGLRNRIETSETSILGLNLSKIEILQLLDNLEEELSTLDTRITTNNQNIETLQLSDINLSNNISSVSNRVSNIENTIYPLDNHFLDKRLESATTLNDLKNWNFTQNPIPNGFEVCIDGIWYQYDASKPESETTGKFALRQVSLDDNNLSAARLGLALIDSATLASIPSSSLPDKYVVIPSEEEIETGNIPSNNYTVLPGSYLEILFSSIRALQNEITKLKNSFEYGILSYKDSNTAISREAVEDTELASEPIWAIDEENLSELVEVAPDLGTTSTSFENTEEIVAVELLGNDRVSFVNNSYGKWEKDLTPYEGSKFILYITTEAQEDTYSGKLIKLELEDLEIPENTLSIDLDSLFTTKYLKYGIFIIVSRKLKVTSGTSTSYKGYNYIWISITDPINDATLAEGYYNLNGTLTYDPKYLDTRYTISRVLFKNLLLSKFNIYSKEEDFSKLVIPSKPDLSEYKYETAHMTIRSVSNTDVLDEISSKLLNDELVWSRLEKKLYIIQNGRKVAIGSASTNSGEPSTDNMTKTELITLLTDAGVLTVKTDSEGNILTYSLPLLSGFTIINETTNLKFDISVDAYGNLQSKLIDDTNTLSKLITDNSVTLSTAPYIRGTIGQIGAKRLNINPIEDTKLGADRVKIGAIYAPLTSDVEANVFGCSHAFIELENTSDLDFDLTDCYLHYKHTVGTETKIETLPLTGTIKAGGTYLIRGKKYAEFDDANCFIKVKTFDQEWYVNGELLDLTLTRSDTAYGLALVYNKPDLSATDILIQSSSTTLLSALNLGNLTTSTYPLVVKNYYIDSLYFGSGNSLTYTVNSLTCWATTGYKIPSNTILKNTFELDPARQAFQSINKMDSSRVRFLNASDIMFLNLKNEYIAFPNSDYKYPVSNFTPKASFENKNVSTDKTKLDFTKPNMLTCSFGINPYTTRTFNWISCGLFDEFILIRLKGTETWNTFESYKDTDDTKTNTGYPLRKEFANDVIKPIYARISGRFPGDGTFFTAHKCIVTIVENAVTGSPVTYEYRVIRKNSDYVSDIFEFTLYPESYTPKIYLTTDQQGFHWVEYQVWNAAAKVINDLITIDCTGKPIMPILINTGDMTLNGTRINEWLDYYNAGLPLFKHLELVNVVGNNDLCNYNPWILGTGDDDGKCNSFYFHLFYCYEIDINNKPIISNTLKSITKYVPSIYYIDFNNYKLVAINSEITESTCENWYKLAYKKNANDINDTIINAYTGYTIEANGSYVASTFGFTPLYEVIYKILNGAGSKQIIVMAHEMPFTVITTDSLKKGQEGISRSEDNKSNLVGSHLNLISIKETKGIYWFSRLLEHFNKTKSNVKLVLGGHKHTFMSSYPIGEYYYYTDEEILKNSYDDGPMTMPESLANDTAVFTTSVTRGETTKTINLSKYPLIKTSDTNQNLTLTNLDFDKTIFPYTKATSDFNYGIVYFMCLATGYKLTSNKELPSTDLKFSYILPGLIATTDQTTLKISYSASKTLKFPMFATIDLSSELDHQYDVRLFAIDKIMIDGNFSILKYSSETPLLKIYNPELDWLRANDNKTGDDHMECWLNYTTASNIITIKV